MTPNVHFCLRKYYFLGQNSLIIRQFQLNQILDYKNFLLHPAFIWLQGELLEDHTAISMEEA